MVSASYFDGRTAKRHLVQLGVVAGRLSVQGEGISRLVDPAGLRISEQLGAAPRRIAFSDGAFCEVSDLARLQPLLERLGHRDGAVDRWQRSWAIAAGSALFFVGSLLAAYFWGLPWTAARVAEHMPPVVVQALSEQTLEWLEEDWLKPSELAPARIAGLREGFAALNTGSRAVPARLLFRTGGELGPNAFALPDGTIVVLDELVRLATHDEQIYGVLGHELGHVYHRHGLRMLVQSTLVGGFLAWWFGDLNSLAAAAPTALLQARYSRELEAEADRYAAALLRAKGLSPSRLAEMFELLARAVGESGDASWMDYLSSHPATRERIQALQAPPQAK